jgi:hypothetical protein
LRAVTEGESSLRVNVREAKHLKSDQSLESFSDLRRVIWALLMFSVALMVVVLLI